MTRIVVGRRGIVIGAGGIVVGAGPAPAPSEALTVSPFGAPNAGNGFAIPGTWSGVQPTSLNYRDNSGAFNPAGATINSDGTWFFIHPGLSAGTYTVTVQDDAHPNVTAVSASFAVASAAGPSNNNHALTFPGSAGSAPSGNSALTGANYTVDGSGNLQVPAGTESNGLFEAIGVITGDYVLSAVPAAGNYAAVDLILRANPTANTQYLIKLLPGGTQIQFQKFLPSFSQATYTVSFAAGDVLSVEDNSQFLTVCQNYTPIPGMNLLAPELIQNGYVGIGNTGNGATLISAVNVTPMEQTPRRRFATIAPKGGSVGTPQRIRAVAANGGMFPAGVTVAPNVTGVAGSSSPASITPSSGTHVVDFDWTPSAAGTATIDFTVTGGPAMTNVQPVTFTANATGALSARLLHSFTLSNWGSGSSAVMARVGIPIAHGDVPAGSSIQIKRGSTVIDAQFDGHKTFDDGSLQHVVAHIRDTGQTLAASASSTYDVWLMPDVAFSKPTATVSLAQISGLHAFTANFANVKSTTDNSTFTTVGTGTFTAALADAISTPTRVTQTHVGAVCDGYTVWAMVGSDAHLKVYWHVDAWKNADGSIYAIEAAPELALDWWNVPNKLPYQYDFTLKDGATTVETYGAVQHVTQCRWIACLNDQSFNRGRRHWLGGVMPTLLYDFNEAYWIKAGVIPPYNTTRSRPEYPNTNNLAYVPIGGQDQRTAVDATGAYDGRGVLPNVHAFCAARQTPQNAAAARINGHVGLHFWGHFRSSRLHRRPGDATADIANTPISYRFYVSDGSIAMPNDDFTADGMPMPVNAYSDYRSDDANKDGYGGTPGGEGFSSLGGAFSQWNYQTQDTSHNVNYSYFSYLYEGEWYHLEAMLDLATNLNGAGLGNGYGEMPQLNSYAMNAAMGAPSGAISAVAGVHRQERSAAWGPNIAVSATLCPDAHPAARFIKRNAQQIAIYLDTMRQYTPASELAAGTTPQNADTNAGCTQPWEIAFQTLAFGHAYRLTRDVRWLNYAKYTANMTINLIADNPYLTNIYVGCSRPYTGSYNSSNQSTVHHRQANDLTLYAVSTSAMTLVDPGNPEIGKILQNGDAIWMMDRKSNGASPSPGNASEFSSYDGVALYVKNITNTGTATPSFGINTKADGTGTDLVFTVNDNFYFSCAPKTIVTVGNTSLYVPGGDDYATIHEAAIVDANFMGNTAATSALVTKQQTYLQNVDYSYEVVWDYATPASAFA